MRSPASPEEATSGAYATQLQRACSSSSGSITCTHDGNREDNGSDADNASSGKDTKALDSQATAWTDSKHSSYLDFMEQNFVRDLYDREYCALDLCGQQAERHADSEDIHELDTAQSRFPDPFGSMELKAWGTGSWTWRFDSKQKMQPWTLLSNPWFKHFRSRKICESNLSKASFLRTGHVEPRSSTSQHIIPDSTPVLSLGFRQKDMVSSLHKESCKQEVINCTQQTSLCEDLRAPKRTVELNDGGKGSSRKRYIRCRSMKVKR